MNRPATLPRSPPDELASSSAPPDARTRPPNLPPPRDGSAGAARLEGTHPEVVSARVEHVVPLEAIGAVVVRDQGLSAILLDERNALGHLHLRKEGEVEGQEATGV